TVELQSMRASPLRHRRLLVARHRDRQVQCIGDRVWAVDGDDHGCVANSFADTAGKGSDHWSSTRKHLLHQRDSEGLHELGPRLAGQYEGRAANHQMWLLVVSDI